MDFEPALFLAVQNEEVGEYAVNGFSCNSDEPRSYCDRCLGWLYKQLFVIFPAVSALAAWVLTL